MCSKILVYETLSFKAFFFEKGFVVWWDVFRVGFAFLEYQKEKRSTAVQHPFQPLSCSGSQDYKPTPRAGFIYIVFTGLVCITYMCIKINAPRFLGQCKVQMFGDSLNPAWRVMWVNSDVVFETAILGLKTFLVPSVKCSFYGGILEVQYLTCLPVVYSPLVALWDNPIYPWKSPF